MEGKWLKRTGPIARFDGRVLGGDVPPSATATLLGCALKIEYGLDDFERQVLDGLAERVLVEDLIRLGREFGATDETMLGALGSLIGKRLVVFE